MFGKKYLEKIHKNDIWALICVAVILTIYAYHTFIAVFPSEHLKLLEQDLRQNEIVKSHTGQIQSVYYEPFYFSLTADSQYITNFYVKGSEKTLLFAFGWTDKYRIEEVFVKDGLFSFRKISGGKQYADFGERLFLTSIPEYIAVLLILYILRVLCISFSSQIMRIVNYPAKLFRLKRFHDTVMPYIFVFNGILILEGFNLLRIIYILIS